MTPHKILHLNYSDINGGAAIGANRLHNALKSCGVHSEMFVIVKQSSDSSVRSILNKETLKQHLVNNGLTKEIEKLYGEDVLIRSLGLLGPDTADAINSSDCDLVHFHWVAGNTIRLSDLPRIKKPIVWKMPDMWAFSGGEHYINHHDTKRYKVGYNENNCPNGTDVDLDRWIWELKKMYYKKLDLTMVSPSRFMAHCAHESILLSPYDCHVIPNPLPMLYIDHKLPSGDLVKQIRRKNGLPENKFLCMFTAFDADEKRKGFQHAEKLIKDYLSSKIRSSKICFVVIGSKENYQKNFSGYTIYFLKKIEKQVQYIETLSCADVLLLPSEMDNSPMVVQEALALGVPTIVFDVGGLPDLVIHKKNGYLAKPYHISDLLEGLLWLFSNKNIAEIKNYAKARATKMHNPENCARAYSELYNKVVNRYREKQGFRTGRLYDTRISKDYPFQPIREVTQPENETKNWTTEEIKNKSTTVDTPQARVVIIDPSVLHTSDSSHNMECCVAYSAGFYAEGITSVWVVNKRCELDNPFGKIYKEFTYTAYDKIRTSIDIRDGYSLTIPNAFAALTFPKEKDVFDIINTVAKAESIGASDVILLPMVDRYLFDGILLWSDTLPSHKRPKLVFVFMFEQASFLPGGYPLKYMMNRVKSLNSKGLVISIGVETKNMQEIFKERFEVNTTLFPPPSLFSSKVLNQIVNAQQVPRYITAFDKARALYEKQTNNSKIPKKSKGQKWVLIPGRGRRDKGYAMLPAIIKKFYDIYCQDKDVMRSATIKKFYNVYGKDQNNVKFIVQRPRGMDNLMEAEEFLTANPNVEILPDIVDTIDLERILEQCDVVLLPYLKQVYTKRGSAFVLKAIAHGKPLVVTKETGLVNDYTKEFVEVAEDVKEYAKSLISVLSGSVNKKAINHSSKRFLESFTTNSTVMKVVKSTPVLPRKKVLIITRGRKNILFKQYLSKHFSISEWIISKENINFDLYEFYSLEGFAIDNLFTSMIDGPIAIPEPLREALNASTYDYIIPLDGYYCSSDLLNAFSNEKITFSSVEDVLTVENKQLTTDEQIILKLLK